MVKRSETRGPGEQDSGLSPAQRYEAAQARAAADRGEFGEFRQQMGFELDAFQIEACLALEAGSGVLVAAPTGAGKTVVGEFAVHLALAAGQKAFYTTPIKALSNQKYNDLVARYGPDDVGLLTGDTSVNSDAPVVVMTTEVLRNMLYANSSALQGLAYVVMDEVHYLADRFRGPVWEEVIIHLPDDVQLVSLSATVSNAEEFGDWLEMVRGDTSVIVSERRPVPLWQHVAVSSRTHHHGPPELIDLYAHDVDPTNPGTNPPISPELVTAMRTGRDEGPRGGDRGYRGRGGRRPNPRGRPGPSQALGRRGPARFAVVEALAEASLLPAIYFIFSRAGCEGAVAQCLGAGLRLTTPAEETRIRTVVETRAASLPPEDLEVLGYRTFSESLARGVAAHHAGMLPIFKETVEELFAAGLVKVVFATETLALGINMPARSVVLEKLVKFNGTTHVDLTPGEYTQLTGRAGRRGIDVEGHAIVVEQQGLDPVALAGLASRRLYPLKSSFRPTYNMAVNLVEQVGRDRAREVLETSFAQFQADRGVVGLAKQAQAHAEALDGYAQAMRCDRGDFGEYQTLRRRISDREKELSRHDKSAARAEAADALSALHRGDIIQILGGRRSGYVTVVETEDHNFDGAHLTVLDADRRATRLTADDVPGGVRVITRIRLPRGFNPRVAAHRRDLAITVRNELSGHKLPRGHKAVRTTTASSAHDDRELTRLRNQLRTHPCHNCPDREDHARWGERWAKLRTEHDSIIRRVKGRTGTIARTFDHICDVLTELHYLAGTDGQVRVTDEGRWLRRLYAENDLVLAECLRRHTWDHLDPPALAAAVSTLVYQARRDDAQEPPIPGGPEGKLANALAETVRVWSAVDDLEAAHKVETTSQPDFGIVRAIHRWATGRSLEFVLHDTDLTAGDFVRNCKQVIDVLDQLTNAAPTPELQATARAALKKLRHGVVAYSSL